MGQKPVKTLLESWRQEMKMAQTKFSLQGTEQWFHSECLFKVELTVFSGRLDVGKRKRGDKNNYKVSDVSIVKLQLTSTEIGKTVNRAIEGGREEKYQEFLSGYAGFKIPIRSASVEQRSCGRSDIRVKRFRESKIRNSVVSTFFFKPFLTVWKIYVYNQYVNTPIPLC